MFFFIMFVFPYFFLLKKERNHKKLAYQFISERRYAVSSRAICSC